MSQSNVFRPWPDVGKNFWFLLRRSHCVKVGYLVDHDHNPHTPKRISWMWWVIKKQFKVGPERTYPFFSCMFFDRFGFYIGWKPISMDTDPFFVLPDGWETQWKNNGKYCEFSVRWTASGGRT